MKKLIKYRGRIYGRNLCGKWGKSKLQHGRNVKLRGKDRANIADCVPLINVGPFGLCKTTGMPCTHACTICINGKNDVLVNGMPALLDKSTAVCPLEAGILKIEDDGQ